MTLSCFLLGWEKFEVEAHKTKVHIIAAFNFHSPFGRLESCLFLDVGLLFLIKKTKGVIMKTWGDARNVTWKEIQLIFTR
jgi:hypothetical protein